MKRCRFARVVGRAVTAADAADAADTECLAPCAFQFNLASIAEVNESGQHLGVLLRIKPREIFVVSLDEYIATGHRTRGHEPLRKIPGAVVIACSAVNFFWIRPNAEIPDVQHPIEARAEGHFECEHIYVEALHRTVNVSRRADQHRHTSHRSHCLI